MDILSTESLEQAVRSLTVAQQTNLGLEISLPVLLPDGDFIGVTVVEDGDGFLVHDSSTAAMYLASSGMKVGESRKKFPGLVARFGCEVSGDRVQRHVKAEQVAAASVMVANAARAVADLALDIKLLATFDFRKIVAEKVEELVGKRVRFNQEVHGKSGRAYHVRNVILDAAQKHPIAFIEPVPTRSSVATHFTEFYDIHDAMQQLKYASVYDDNSDIRAADMNLLRQVSDVFAFGESEIRIKRIANAEGTA
ncbi:MAG TPA: hypothetical protein VHW73_14480 [Rudaea sp.]|jgi:hypothetical protein|nr:hypothetical protein [Rudaea sp.]